MDARFKQLIVNKLYMRLSNAEIIPYNDSIWFIDREKSHWYFELTNTGKLWWRYDYFTNFFKVYSLNDSQFVPLLSEWVEDVLNHKVSTTQRIGRREKTRVEEVLNSKVSTTVSNCLVSCDVVEEVLNSKVSTTESLYTDIHEPVEDVLNHRVNTTVGNIRLKSCKVEEVLNHKVIETQTLDRDSLYWVNEVLNENPTE